MTQQWTLPAWAVVLPAVAGLVLLLVVLVLAARVRRTERRVVGAGQDLAALRTAVEDLEALGRGPAAPVAAPPAPARPDYVITRVGDDPEDGERGRGSGAGAGDEPVVAAPLFADLVLRESVVQAASLAAGLRRALAPESRHRVRLEMRREVKRARKQRRADLRAFRRDRDARQRAHLDTPAERRLDEGSAA